MVASPHDAVAPRRGPPRVRLAPNEVPRLHLPDLLRSGHAWLDHAIRRGVAWDWTDGREIIVTVTADLDADRGELQVQHRGGDAYAVAVGSIDAGGDARRWWLRCPSRGLRTPTLFLPHRARRFASRHACEATRLVPTREHRVAA